MQGTPAPADNRSMTLRILRSRCCGSASCSEIAPDVFALDAQGRTVVIDPEAIATEAVLEAAEACPSQAIEI